MFHTHTHMHLYIYISLSHVYTYEKLCIIEYINKCIHIYIYTYIYIYIYVVYIHTRWNAGQRTVSSLGLGPSAAPGRVNSSNCAASVHAIKGTGLVSKVSRRSLCSLKMSPETFSHARAFCCLLRATGAWHPVWQSLPYSALITVLTYCCVSYISYIYRWIMMAQNFTCQHKNV